MKCSGRKNSWNLLTKGGIPPTDTCQQRIGDQIGEAGMCEAFPFKGRII